MKKLNVLEIHQKLHQYLNLFNVNVKDKEFTKIRRFTTDMYNLNALFCIPPDISKNEDLEVETFITNNFKAPLKNPAFDLEKYTKIFIEDSKKIYYMCKKYNITFLLPKTQKIEDSNQNFAEINFSTPKKKQKDIDIDF
jgi:hypothetical protein